MRRDLLAADVVIATVIAIIVLLLAPGTAIAAMLGLVVLTICVIGVLRDLRRQRRAPVRRRSRTESRAPHPRAQAIPARRRHPPRSP